KDVELAPQDLDSCPPVRRDGQLGRSRRQREVGVECGRQVLVEHALDQVQVSAAGRKAVGLLEQNHGLAPYAADLRVLIRRQPLGRICGWLSRGWGCGGGGGGGGRGRAGRLSGGGGARGGVIRRVPRRRRP